MKKDSQEKAPIYTFLMQFRNAIEQLALRSLEGHLKYEEHDQDWTNFKRVDNPDFEYSNALIRHALGLGEDDELDHYIAAAWNAIARLEMKLEEATPRSASVVKDDEPLEMMKNLAEVLDQVAVAKIDATTRFNILEKGEVVYKYIEQQKK